MLINVERVIQTHLSEASDENWKRLLPSEDHIMKKDSWRPKLFYNVYLGPSSGVEYIQYQYQIYQIWNLCLFCKNSVYNVSFFYVFLIKLHFLIIISNRKSFEIIEKNWIYKFISYSIFRKP